MRWHFLLIPAAVVASAPAMAGAYYLTIEQAQDLLFPGAAFTEEFYALTDSHIEIITAETKAPLWNRKVRAWRVSTGGWFILDQVLGRDDWVNYAVGLDANGAVIGVEVLECWEQYNQIRLPAWLAQFKGRRHTWSSSKQRAKAEPNRGIEIISGTTLSSVHITEGVTRVLATFALVIAPSKL